MKELVGFWELKSLTFQLSDGTETQAWGQVLGRIAYTGDGQMSAMLMHERRNEAAGTGFDHAVAANYSAYFGSYIVDQQRGIIRHTVVGSLTPNATGVLERTFMFEDGNLILGFTAPFNGGSATRRLIWQRMTA